MNICGIDQSFTSTGACVISKDGDLIFADKYASDTNDDIYSRAWEIAGWLSEVAKEHNVAFCVLEGLAFASHGDATRNLAGLQFVLYCVLHFIEGHKVEVVVPTVVKKFATGNGRATKEEIIEKLPTDVLEYFKALGVKKTTGLADLADAYFIAKYYQHLKTQEHK